MLRTTTGRRISDCPRCLLSGFKFRFAENVDQNRKDIAINDRLLERIDGQWGKQGRMQNERSHLNLLSIASCDVGNGPAGFFPDRLFWRGQQLEEALHHGAV